MTSSNDEFDVTSVVVGMIIGVVLNSIVLAFVLTMFDDTASLKQQAIERNVAAYNSKTGDWEWTVKPLAVKKEEQ